MDYMTIGEVSSLFQISTRMLRYYEKTGLIENTRKEGYAYRIYDTDSIRKIQQIIILRKLQIPLKQIRSMMDGNKEETIRIPIRGRRPGRKSGECHGYIHPFQ